MNKHEEYNVCCVSRIYIYLCSTTRGRIKGAARSIKCHIVANRAIFSLRWKLLNCGGNYSTVVIS